MIEYYMFHVVGEQFDASGEEWKLNGITIDEELFERIRTITLVVAGLKNIKSLSIQNIKKPQWLIEKEEEINKIKRQTNGNKNHFEELMKIFLPLNYELGYSLDELFHMNYYHIQYLARYIPKIVSYDVQKRQIMSKKKIKYITEK